MIIIPKSTPLHTQFNTVGQQARAVFFAGLPGVGKSLLLQQFALMAHENGRIIHSLQWDVTRATFENAPENLAKYPEIDGATQPIMRKAVGMWAREGVHQWHTNHPNTQHLLVGEVPLIGNRLIELVQQKEDDVETLLTDPSTVFFLPVPSKAVRAIIENAREKTIANPQHEKEKNDAQPNVLRAMWQDVVQLGYELGLSKSEPAADLTYDPAVYTAVFDHLLQHRNTITLHINDPLTPQGSAYDIDIIQSELSATPADVKRIVHQLETEWTMPQIEKAVAQWAIL